MFSGAGENDEYYALDDTRNVPVKQIPVLGQVLSQRQSAILAPQLQQGVRMLQLSSAELQEELELVLQQNPFLEKLELDENIEYSEPLGNQTYMLNAVKDQGGYESGVIQGGIAQPFIRSLPLGG